MELMRKRLHRHDQLRYWESLHIHEGRAPDTPID